MQPLVDRLRTAPANGLVLENVLPEIEQETNPYTARKSQLLAIRCYLREIISGCASSWFGASNGVTNFHSLVDPVERWRIANDERVTYVTFNYDTLLEWALADVIRDVRMEDFGYFYREFHLYKPHGSVDWVRPIGPLQGHARWTRRQFVFAFAGQYLEDKQPIVSPDITQFEKEIDGELFGLIPALALPIRDKLSFEFESAHLGLMTNDVRQTSRVIAIGWRGLESHFVDLWRTRNNLFDLLVVAQDQQRRATDSRKSRGPRAIGVANRAVRWWVLPRDVARTS
jgi:hypothetical protein